jgi:hypothetical protein
MRKNSAVLLVFALAVAFLLNTELLPYVLSQTQNNGSVSAPTIQWQKKYGDTHVEVASNLIQTSDGGYVFMDLGYSYNSFFKPSFVYKVDSSGSLQWNKTIFYGRGRVIIQTSDEGYEITGHWATPFGIDENGEPYGTAYKSTPTLVKTNSEGNIQWVQNYTTEPPNLGIDFETQPNGFGYRRDGMIQTSDGGFVYWQRGTITKTDLNNNTQWVITVTYPTLDAYPTYTRPLSLFSVIETSNGALAALGVGYELLDNSKSGNIYVIKTEAFLPLPSQAPLPTPIPTPTPTPLPASTVEAEAIVSIMIAVVVGAGLLVYFKKRKH